MAPVSQFRVNVSSALALTLIGALTLAGISTLRLQMTSATVTSAADREQLRLRNATAALFDLVRLTDIVADLPPTTLGAADRKELSRVTDQIYVRTDTLWFEARYSQEHRLERQLWELVAHIDDILGHDHVTGIEIQQTLLPVIDASNLAVFRYTDEQSDVHGRAIEHERAALRRMIGTAMILFAVFGVVGAAAVLLWRSERMSRHRRQAAEDEARFLAFNDPLTRLANRRRFSEVARGWLERGHELTLLLVDLDEFKNINDTYGHSAGDAVLLALGERLSSAIAGQTACAARLGGDEFAVVFPRSLGDGEITAFCSGLIEKMNASVVWEDTSLHPRLSIGVARGGPDGLAALLRAADYALYDSKSAGRNTFRFYDADLAKRITDRRRLGARIPGALVANEFFVEYQPQISLSDGTLIGFEALIRWNHDGAVIPPGAFIPIAEQSGLITRLDLWVMDQAIAEAREWERLTSTPPGVSVNLSALHFSSDQIVEDVATRLERSGLAPGRLTLELTESTLIRDWQGVSTILQALRRMGVKIALDDFGTGYSSLSYLRRLKVDEVKIDRSFVTDLETSRETRFMLDALVDIVTGLHMELVVEGVETQEQVDILADFGCNLAQGFFFGRPMPVDEARACISATGPGAPRWIA